MPTAQLHAPLQSVSISARSAAAPCPSPGEGELRCELTRLLPDLYSRALRMTRNHALAQDVVQDTIERALRFEAQYQPGSNLRAWMQKILFSVFVTRCRRARRERSALSSLSLDPCAWTLPESPPAMTRLSPPAMRAVASLPSVFREAIELVDLAELSYKDAADLLGIPLGTVMSRLHRGRRILSLALGPQADGPLPRAA